jgi:tetratricopeptide (TPR) repeat protein
LKALKMAEETGYKQLQANTLGNLGLLYSQEKDKVNALDYYFKALNMADELGYKQLQANTLGNIGDIYFENNDLVKAISHYNIALKIKEEIGDKRETAVTLRSIGKTFVRQKKYSEAEKFLLRAVAIADTLRNYTLEMDIHGSLSELYRETSDWKKAYANFFLYSQCKDSVTNEQKQKEITRKEMDFEYAKKSAADSIKSAEEKKVIAAHLLANEEQLKRETTQRYALYGGLALLFVFGGFMYNRFRIIKNQNKIIENQKTEVENQRDIARQERESAHEQRHIVEAKQKEILDSIHYAKRIQRSLLPNETYFEKELNRLNKNEKKK